MRTLNGALSLKTGADGAFATLDLMQLDMFTGRAAFYKLAPRRHTSNAGLQGQPQYRLRPASGHRLRKCGGPTSQGLPFAPGDFIIMASDGLY
jgi:hypothetical protein